MNGKNLLTSLIAMMIGALCMVYGASPQGNARKTKEGSYKYRKTRTYETKPTGTRTGSVASKKKRKQNPTADSQVGQDKTQDSANVQERKPKVEGEPSYSEDLKQKAESGDAAAQLDLALCYDRGSGIEKNPVEAHKWFLKAAEQGNGRALNAVGSDYENGTGGVEKDIAEAVKWYRKSAEQGSDRGQNNLGRCYQYGNGVEKDLTEAVKWYRKSAEQGNAFAQCNLGWCYESGNGVEKDLTEAVKWYRKSAEQGNTRAQRYLGGCYGGGKGVTKDEAEAVKWFRKSAEQGDASAQFVLAFRYELGKGVTKNEAEAVKWYRKSAEQGNAGAQCFLGLCYAQGRGVTKDVAEAVKLFRKAAEQGNAMAQYSLGVCYLSGEGVEGDMEEAFKWVSKSAKQGYERAKELLKSPQFSLVKAFSGNADDLEAGEVCLRKLKEFKKDGRFSVATPTPQGDDMLVIKGLYIGMPVDDAVVACGKIASSSEDYLVVDSRMLKEDKWSQFKALEKKVKDYNGVCILSSKNAKRIQDTTLLCVVRLNENGNVKRVFFTDVGMQEIFKARDLSTEEFAKALLDNYPQIPSLSKTVKDKRENGVDIREYRWKYESTHGYNVDLYENTILVQGEEVNLAKYKSIMAGDPNALGVAIGESLFNKYLSIGANVKKGQFD